MRRGAQLLVLMAAVVVGYVGAGVITPGVVAPSMTPEPGSRTVASVTTTTTLPASTTTSTPEAEVYLVWSTGGLTPDLVGALQDGFHEVSIVRGDSVELADMDDWVIPLDGLAIDPGGHRPFDPDETLSALEPGTVALAESSAAFRDAALGDELSISGSVYRVAAVVPDDVVGAAEVVFSAADEGAPVSTARYALVRSALERTEFERTVRAMYEGPAPLRIRSQDETPWLRHGDAVLPQIFIKTALGEFSYGDLTGAEFTQDPAFVAEHIVEAEVPILGAVTCHETVAEMLSGAMSELVDRGLGHLVDPSDFAGCWNPRYIRPTTGTSAGLSRHAWGAALDINAGSNPVGSAGTQDPRLVEVMLDWGFTWGGDWLVPDPMHFEYGIAP